MGWTLAMGGDISYGEDISYDCCNVTWYDMVTTVMYRL